MDKLGPLVINTDGSIARDPLLPLCILISFHSRALGAARYQQLARDD